MNTTNIIDILEPVRLGYADILYQNQGDIVIHELRSDAIMISMSDLEKFKEIYKQYQLNQYHLFAVHQEHIKDLLIEYGKTYLLKCYQAVYKNNQYLDIDYPEHISIHNLTDDYIQVVLDHYHQMDDKMYIQERIFKKHLWGLFVEKTLAGFIGIHDEGSMGLLEIFPEFQRRGYGAILESYLINYYLSQEWVPYCQVVEGNVASLRLQRKLGLEISSELSYWLSSI